MVILGPILPRRMLQGALGGGGTHLLDGSTCGTAPRRRSTRAASTDASAHRCIGGWRCARCPRGAAGRPRRRQPRVMSSPAMTSVSLFARPTVLPASMARRVGTSPTAPTVAESTKSASGWVATSTIPSTPVTTVTSGNDALSLSASSWRARLTISGRKTLTCCSSCSRRLPAARPMTSNRSGKRSTTLSVLVPTEPVEPSMEIPFNRPLPSRAAQTDADIPLF